MKVNPMLDLIFERKTPLTPAQIWQGWSDPKILMRWFCPLPWKVIECRINLCPGGEFFTVMQGPQGETSANSGVYLQVLENEKLVWTNIMTESFRPVSVATMGFPFVVHLNITPLKGDTLYTAVVSHVDQEGRLLHEKMGFHEGWEMAFNQLEKLMGH